MMVLRPALRPIPTLCSSIAPPAGSSLNGGVKRCLPLRIAAFSNTPEWYEKKRARALSGTGILVGDLVGTGKGIKVGDLLGSGTATKSNTFKEEEIADHSWRQQNHIWTQDELAAKMKTKDSKHTPVTLSDKLMSFFMQSAYHSFNFITGYREVNPPTRSIEWRLIVLESFAGVPGFMAAAFRHFHSLRTLQRDHGAIFTLLEEAENERMHLLVCMKMFEAGFVTRSLVVAAQVTMTPFLALTYAISPGAMHRFVGYLEETAVHTYANIIEHVDTPGTHLHKSWSTLGAPDVAKNYWRLEPGADKWRDVLCHILADEAHHRDVNHTYASLGPEDENPFIEEHKRDFDAAVARRVPDLLKMNLEKSLMK